MKKTYRERVTYPCHRKPNSKQRGNEKKRRDTNKDVTSSRFFIQSIQSELCDRYSLAIGRLIMRG